VTDRASLSRRFVAELLGTALLLAAVVGSGIMAAGLADGNQAIALLCNTIPTGAILFVLITILGPLSGAHLNPAVSLAMALVRKLPWYEVAPYIAAQIVGAVTGALLAHLMFELPILQVSTTSRWGTGQWAAEFVAAFGLVMVIFGCLRHNAAATASAVGLYIIAAYWFTASTSFANPAVTIARGLTDTFSGIAPVGVPAFIVAQLLGAGAAVKLSTWLWDEQATR
jgi:glycerol uptake facilitator-like aquaporin